MIDIATIIDKQRVAQLIQDAKAQHAAARAARLARVNADGPCADCGVDGIYHCGGCNVIICACDDDY